MPSSTDYAIPRVLWLIRELKPESVLDVGCGTGKYGALVRFAVEEGLPPEQWKNFRIEGLDVHLAQRTHWHDLYDRIILGEFRESIDSLGVYDVIYLGDIIEHFEKAEGQRVISQILTHARRGVIVTTPYHFFEQHAINGNEFERHRSWWTESDFKRFPHSRCWVEYRRKLIGFVSNQPIVDLNNKNFGTRRWISSFLERRAFSILGLNRGRWLKKLVVGNQGDR